jgi:hypothetical protein
MSLDETEESNHRTVTGEVAARHVRYAVLADWVAAGSLLAFLVFFGVAAFQKGAADLSGIAPTLVTALLGAVNNPPKNGKTPPIGVWIALVVVAGVVSVLSGVLTLFSSSHPGAVGAFAASVGGLAGLLIDTSDFSVVKRLLG